MIRSFFIGSALPPLVYKEMPDISFTDMMALLEENLSNEELKQVRLLRMSIDIENIRRYLQNEPFDHRGVLTEKEIDEAILNHVNFPEFLYDFLVKYEGDDRNRYYGEVVANFYKEISKQGKGFVKDYFAFERNLRLVMTGYRAKRLGLDIAKELQFEDPKDPMVAFVLAGLGFPFEFSDLEHVLKQAGDDPMKQHDVMVKYRYDWIRNHVSAPYFSLDAILGNVMRHILLEDACSLDRDAGWNKMKEAV